VIGVRVLKEPLSLRQIVGLVCGFGGVVLVLSPAFTTAHSMTVQGVIAVLIALAGSTTATLVQKKSGSAVPLVPGTAFQYFVAAILFLAAATVTRGFNIQWTGKFIFALGWLVLALSVGAILILLTLLKHGSASKVSSLLYLVPPATAVEAYFLFNERLTKVDFVGIMLTAIGVSLVIRKK
jgi:drug/metabolite transporter (DMT)-like permease